MRSHACPKCQGTMAEGFIITEQSGMAAVSGWSEGPPRKGWWGYIKKPGKSIPIATWRCQRCGFLENYARNPK